MKKSFRSRSFFLQNDRREDAFLGSAGDFFDRASPSVCQRTNEQLSFAAIYP
jgi:hypothetical protein